MNLQRISLTLTTLITVLATVSVSIPFNLRVPFSTSQVLAQSLDARKAEADRLLQQGYEQLQISQFEAAKQSWQEA